MRELDAPGVERLTGAGIYYGAALTEAANYRDRDVFVVGGANSAGQGAMFFSRYAEKVTMLVRGSRSAGEHVPVSDRPDRQHAQHRRADAHDGHRRCWATTGSSPSR